MKSFFVLLLICFIGQQASASDLISLYAQGCLPYMENGSAIFNCASEEVIGIELKDSGSGVATGEWSKVVNLEKSSIVVSLKINKFTLSSGNVITLITGQVNDGNGAKLVSTTNNLSADLSVSLASLVPYGKKKGFPHFFFGTPSSFNEQTSAHVMQSSFSGK